MKQLANHIALLLIGALLGMTIAIGQGVWADKDAGNAGVLPLNELRLFTEVFDRIKNDYVEEVDDKTLLENAIRGMLSGLDPHSSYLDPEAYKELQIGTTGEFGGLGIEVGMEDGFVRVIAPIDDTPAQKAGILAGDLIIRLDDTPVKGLTLSEAVKIMRGKPGTKILLTIVREGEDKPLKISIERAIIKVTSVKSRLEADGLGYLRVTHFQARTGADVERELKALKKEYGKGLKGLVLDLRNNPGGVLHAAVAVSDAFLTEGLIVYTEGRVKDSKQQFKATAEDILDGAPLVVLVNSGSASASEIVAGALQDQSRAVVMGRPTFGKGSVQTVLPISGAALKLTTARYYTPSGRSIQAEGIIPDILLENLKVSAAPQPTIDHLKEADLKRHLENTGTDVDNTENNGTSAADSSLASKDYQLYEAFNLLKGLVILQNKNKI
ncbi:MAG TPA: peptidase S41 [Gammaproteobacteria bacterium]|nr:peptidase S41 [Gammaproteobacteria bacterium]